MSRGMRSYQAAMRRSCSYGNAGMVVPSHFVPLAAPGMVGLGLRWMLDPASPFHVKPRISGEFVAWALRFVRAATHEHVARAAPLLRSRRSASAARMSERAYRTSSSGAPLVLSAAAVGQRVGALVLRVSGVAAHPVPLDIVRPGQRVQALPQVDVLDRLAGGGLPTAGAPAGHPLGDSVPDVDAVGVDVDPERGAVQRLQGAGPCPPLPPVVGGWGGLAPAPTPAVLAPPDRNTTGGPAGASASRVSANASARVHMASPPSPQRLAATGSSSFSTSTP